MQHSAVFVGGALLGGVLAAACGFDLYPVEEVAHATLVDLEARNAGLEQELILSREDGRLLIESENRAHDFARRAREDLDLVREELDEARAQKDDVTSQVDELRGDLALLTEELDLTREELTRARGELALVGDHVRRAERDLFEMALRFFSVPRPADDRDLAASFLASRRSEEEVVALTVALRLNSPELLLSLGLARPGACPLETLGDIEGAAMVPAGARLEERPN